MQVHGWHATVLAVVVNRMNKESLAISKLNNVALHFFFIDAFLHWTKKRIYLCLQKVQICGRFGAPNLH